MSDPSKDITVAFQSDTGEEKPPAALADETPVRVGSVLLNRFKLIGHAGEGGMSHVYKAIDLRKVEARLGEPYVAVKLLTAPSHDHSRVLAMLQGEAQKLQSLTHPNIVRVFDCDRDGSTVFMTMEYLSGEPLKRLTVAPDFKGLPHGEALRIIDAIGSALMLAHRSGIVHGDLKPGNVMITERGEVKVIDFGIARAMTRPKRETAGLTVSYASPQLIERLEPDMRDDVYALACMSYELLTGEHPFGRSDAVSAREAGLKVKASKELTHRQFKAIDRALHFDREARTSSIEQFMRELHGAAPTSRWLIPLGLIAVVAFAFAGYWLSPFRHPAGVVSPPAVHAPTVSVPALTPGKLFRDCPTCPLMVVLPSGHFEQGAAADDAQATPFERPRHAVAIAHPFAVGVNEITRGEFREFLAATNRDMRGCEAYEGSWKRQAQLSWSDLAPTQTPQHPMSCVSWNDARAYVEWLSQKTGHRYRLPSASEWEYAGVPAAGDLCAQANVADQSAAERFPGWKTQSCRDGYTEAAPVGSFAANSFGLHDMYGNVFEWTEDCWQDDYRHAAADGSPQQEGNCAERELRGGSWFTAPQYLRRSYRNRFATDYRSTSVGLRIARDIEP